MFDLLPGALAVVMFVTQAPAAPKDTKTIVTLSGCVSRDPATPGAFTFAETGTGTKYKLGGASVRKYIGQRVELVGGQAGRRLSIRGGLLPSPNVAAQAGAIDPTKAAMANQPGGPGNGTGTVALPEFRVTSVRSLGSCQ